MNTALHSAMKVGIVQFMAYPEAQRADGPHYETIEKIAEDAFFGAIEITTIPDPAVRARVARRPPVCRPGRIEVVRVRRWRS